MAIVFNPRNHPTLTFTSPLIPSWRLLIDVRDNPTLEEVLVKIHFHLNKPVGRADFDKAQRGDRILKAHAERCRARGLTQSDREPLRRVDYFLGRQFFRGLIDVDGDPTSWEIVLE